MQNDMVNLIKTFGIGGFGGVAHYLYQISKGEKFHWGLFCINVIIASFIGWLVGSFIPIDVAWRDGVIGISGASSLQIMSALQSKGGKLIIDALRILITKK